MYKLIGNGDIYDIKRTVLNNRNIEEDLFELTEEVIEDYMNYDNMIKGVELLHKHLENDSKIAFVVDSDADGNLSSSALYNYIKNIYPNANITTKLHTGKQHGLSSDINIDDFDLVILPDSSSGDYEKHKELFNRGIDILVLDHHHCEKYSEYACVINNQLSDKVGNKSLCGVGVVYKFCKAMDDYLGESYADEFLDLVAIGNVADGMDLKSKETRYFVKEGLQVNNNNFIKAIKEVKSYDMDGKNNITTAGWTIAPLINACIRSGTIKEKREMFNAFISDNYEYCLKVANACKNIKSRQDNAVKKAMPQYMDLEGDKVILIESSKLGSTLRGLVANKLMNHYKKHILMYSKKDDEYLGGSFRGVQSLTDSLYTDIENSGIAEVLGGHDLAGGWQVKKDRLQEFEDYLNNLYKDRTVKDKTYEVDFVVDFYDLEQWMVDELAEMEDEWGNGLDKPLVAITNVCTNDIKINRTNIVFDINGIKGVKKYPTKILKEKVEEGFYGDVVGSASVNSYDGVGQIEVEELIFK